MELRLEFFKRRKSHCRVTSIDQHIYQNLADKIQLIIIIAYFELWEKKMFVCIDLKKKKKRKQIRN